MKKMFDPEVDLNYVTKEQLTLYSIDVEDAVVAPDSVTTTVKNDEDIRTFSLESFLFHEKIKKHGVPMEYISPDYSFDPENYSSSVESNKTYTGDDFTY